MNKKEIIEGISSASNGDIYLGVVGSVRTGKSTFIKKIIETLVVPNIEDEYEKKICLDEIPQTSSGKTVMTVEPKFVPSNGATIKIDEFKTNIKLVDSVGYVTPMAKGQTDDMGNPRMVKTPWFDEEIPFNEAAEVGTSKVIKDHATIGIVVTTDGSFGELPRENFIEAEKKVITELKEINKPFVVIYNTVHPSNDDVINTTNNLKNIYNVPVIPMSVESMTENDALNILKTALYEFPIDHIEVNIPDWIDVLSNDHHIKKTYLERIKECITDIDKLKDIDSINLNFEDTDIISNSYISNINTVNREVTITLESPEELFESTLHDIAGVSISSKKDILKMLIDYNEGKNEFDGIKSALKQVYQVGYGIVSPKLSDMKLEKPEIIKQGGRYGVKLKAVASSIHMLKVDVESTFEPIIGTELQSKQLIDSLMKDGTNDIWKSEIFGRSLEKIVQEGIQAKLSLLPETARYKLCQTLTKMINKGSNNLIAIVI